MDGNRYEFQSTPGSVVATKTELRNMETYENASTYNCDYSQYGHQLIEGLSSNENNMPVDNDCYNITYANLRQNDWINQQSTNSDALFEQQTKPNIVFSDNEQQFSTMIVTTVTPILGSTSTYSTSKSVSRCRPTSAIINPSSSSINSVCPRPDNYNLTCGHYYTTMSTTEPPDNPEGQSMTFTYNQLPKAQYTPNIQQGNMQTESINFVLAHQWQESREKLPAKIDTAFFNRAGAVNVTEIQKQKLQFLQKEEEKKLVLKGVNQKKKKPKPKKKDQHLTAFEKMNHSYRQPHQQNHLPWPNPDGLSSSQQFAYSPLPVNSSTDSGQQLQHQTFPHTQLHSYQQIQRPIVEAHQPNNINLMNRLTECPTQQQQLEMQLIQQQRQQQYWQQQWYHKALSENVARNESLCNSEQRLSEIIPREVVQDVLDKEYPRASASLEPLDESPSLDVLPSNDQSKNLICDDDLKQMLMNINDQTEANLIVNMDVKIIPSNDDESVKTDEPATDKHSYPPAHSPTDINLIDSYEVLQDWIQKQPPNID